MRRTNTTRIRTDSSSRVTSRFYGRPELEHPQGSTRRARTSSKIRLSSDQVGETGFETVEPDFGKGRLYSASAHRRARKGTSPRPCWGPRWGPPGRSPGDTGAMDFIL